MSRGSALRIALCVIALASLVGIGITSLRSPSPGVQPAPRPYRPAGYTISLEREGCFGECPAFELTIQGTGLALLTGRGFRADAPERTVSWRLSHPIDPATHLALITTAEQEGFRALDLDYSVMVTDMPSTTIALRSSHGAALTHVYAVPCEREAAKDRRTGRQREFEKPVPDVFCSLAHQLDAVACDVYQNAQSRDNTILVRFPPRCPP